MIFNLPEVDEKRRRFQDLINKLPEEHFQELIREIDYRKFHETKPPFLYEGELEILEDGTVYFHDKGSITLMRIQGNPPLKAPLSVMNMIDIRLPEKNIIEDKKKQLLFTYGLKVNLIDVNVESFFLTLLEGKISKGPFSNLEIESLLDLFPNLFFIKENKEVHLTERGRKFATELREIIRQDFK